MKKFEVPIVYRGQDNFIVEADTPEQAEEKARAMFNNGDSPLPLGNEWETIERVGDIEEVPQLDAAERKVVKPSTRKFHRKLVLVEILSEEPIPDDQDLDVIHHQITDGDCSGKVTTVSNEEIDAPTCARLLEQQGSDPSFFQLTPEGENVNED